MFEIEKYIWKIMEELHGAKEYAIKYVEYKSKSDSKCSKYKDMAEQELQHAKNFYEFSIQEMEILSRGQVPTNLKDEFQKAQDKYAEKVATIKYMLSL